MSDLAQLQNYLRQAATPAKAKASSLFFKTGPGQYGEGDVFIGVTVPEQRKIARQYRNLALSDLEKLLNSPIHEERLVALIILVYQYRHGDAAETEAIYQFYLQHTTNVNNWDLVDSSAAEIVGCHLDGRDKKVLAKLAESDLLWERRIAMVATYYFIKQGEYREAFEVAELLINDREDLIQKAVGWMLREVGKKSGHPVLEAWLAKHYHQLGRTALRYSIEHFSTERRQEYLKGTIKA